MSETERYMYNFGHTVDTSIDGVSISQTESFVSRRYIIIRLGVTIFACNEMVDGGSGDAINGRLYVLGIAFIRFSGF